MKNEISSERICPKCGCTYTDRPAQSRYDSEIFLCPDCGVRESLEIFGTSKEEQDKIISIIHRSIQQ